MIMKTFPLSIASPDGIVFSGDVYQLSVRGIAGELAILAGHIPFVTALADGECRIYCGEDADGIKRAHVTSGMLIVSKEKTRLLTSDFEWKNE